MGIKVFSQCSTKIYHEDKRKQQRPPVCSHLAIDPLNVACMSYQKQNGFSMWVWHRKANAGSPHLMATNEPGIMVGKLRSLSRSPCDLVRFYNCFYNAHKMNHHSHYANHMVIKQIHLPVMDIFLPETRKKTTNCKKPHKNK